MIDKKSVRFGNIIWDSHYEQVRTLGFTDIYEMGMGRAAHLTPIELSEEWLLKLGFKKKEESIFENIKMPYWVHEAVCLFFNEGAYETSYLAGYGFTTFNGIYTACTFRWIENVHTLQNIFSSLTGKELTIKEPINDNKNTI